MKSTITKVMVMLSLLFFAISAKGQDPCATPAPLTVLSMTPTTAQVMWNTGSGSPADLYNVKVSTVRLANPTTGTADVFSGSVNINGLSFPNLGLGTPTLVQNTKYYFYVRSDCQSVSYNGYSVWVLDSITTPCSPVGLPVVENFDATNLPQCWRAAGGKKPVTSNSQYFGTSGRSLLLQSTTSADAFLISPSVSALANNLEITFKANGAVGTQFRVGILDDIANLTSITDISSAPVTVTLSGWNEYTITTPSTLAAVSGKCIVFYMPAGTANTVYLDNIDIHVKPTCPRPQGLKVSNITDNSVYLSWTETGTATAWKVRYITGTDTLIVPATTNPFTLPGLLPLHNYKVDVATNCGTETSFYCTPATFNTPQTPAVLPYSYGFEDNAENALWTLQNGAQANKWFIGTVAAAVNSGSKALYISDNASGTTYNYNNGSISYTWAYRTFNFANAGVYGFSFNWQANGESTFDLLRAFLVPASVTPTAGDAQGMTGSTNTTPTGWIDVTTGSTTTKILNLQTTWQLANNEVRITTPGFYNLVFFWKNDGSGGTQPPAAIDNISVQRISCPSPSAVAVSNITTTDAQVSWTAGGSESSWQVRVMNGTHIVTQTVVNANPTTITGISGSTSYTVQVRAICAVGDTSLWSAATGFKTLCGTAAIPFEEDFNSYTSSSTTWFNSCWTRYTGTDAYVSGSTVYPYISTSYGNSLYFYQSATTVNAAFLPLFNVTGVDLQIEFDLQMAATNRFDVVTTTNPASARSTWTVLKTINDGIGTGATSYKHYEIIIPNYQTGTYIGLVSHTGSSTSAYLDNIVVGLAPTCLKPTISSSVTSNSATITLTGSNATQWQYLISTSNTMPALSDAVNVSTNPFTIPALNANTQYYIWVRGDCGAGNYSQWAAGNFKTMCLGITTLPWTETFENGVFTFDCWQRYGNTPTNIQLYATNYSSATNNSSSGPYYLSYRASDNYTAVLPPFAMDVNTLQIKFWSLREGGSSGTLQVGYLTDINNAASFVAVTTFNDANATWFEHEVMLASVPAGIKNIALKTPSGSSAWYYWVDDIIVDLLPSCVKPTISSAVTSNSATITLAGSNATQWQYLISTTNTMPALSDAVNVSTNPFTIPGLTANTQYNIWVRSVCGVGVYSDWATGNFKTLCEAITTLPWNYGFENLTAENQLPDCWSATNFGSSGKIRTQIVDYTTTPSYNRIAHSGNAAIYFVYGCNDSISTPRFYLEAGKTYVFSFWWIKDNSSGWQYLGASAYDALGSFVSLVGTPIASFPTTSDGYQKYEGTFTPATNGEYYFNVRCQANSSPWYLTLDDFKVIAPTCFNPQSLNVGTVTESTVTVTVVDNNVSNSAWDFVIGAPGFNPDAATNIISSTAKTKTLTALTQNTNYSIYVRANCGTNGVSEWIGPLTFKTECSPINVPYTETFEPTDVNSRISCWTTSITPTLSTAQHQGTGTTSIYISSPMTAVSPRLNVAQLADYQVTGYAYSTVDSARFTILVGTDPSETYGFEPVAEFMIPTKNKWVDFGTTFDTLNNVLMSDFATSKYVMFYFPTSKPIYIDNVKFELIPSCPRPDNLAVSNIGANSATINWKGYNETSWQLQILKGTSIVKDTVVTTHPVTINGLQMATNYNIALRAICSATDTSVVSTYAFTTICGVINSYPFTENFDGYTGTAYNVAGPIPNCWYTYAQSGLAQYKPHVTNGTSYNYYHSSPNSMGFVGGTATTYGGPNTYAVLPAFNTPISQLIISLWYKQESTSYGKFSIGYITGSQDNIASFTPLIDLPVTTTIRQFEYNFADAGVNLSAATYIAIRWNYTGSSYYGGSIDDISVTRANGNALQILPNAIYTQIPTSQTFTPSAKAKNIGLDAQTNVALSVKLNGANVGTSAPYATLNPTDTTSTLTAPAVTIPLGKNTMIYTVKSTEGATDNDTVNIAGTEDTFAADDVTTQRNGVGANSCCITMGHIFEITSTTYMTQASIIFGNFTNSDNYTIELYPMTGNLTTAVNPLFTVTATRTAGPVNVDVPVTQLVPGKYFLCINQLTANNVAVAYDANPAHLMYEKDGQDLYADNGFGAIALRMIVSNTALTCTHPTALTVNDITSSGASISWTAGGTESQWVVQYKKAGDVTWVTYDTVTTASATINILLANTAYDVRVKAVCGAGGVSGYSNVVSFTTLCTAITNFPWNYGFEDLTADNQLPNCWSATNFGSSGKVRTQIVDYSSYNRKAHTGTAAMYFVWSCNDSITTPIFHLKAGKTYVFSFWWIKDDNAGWQYLGASAHNASNGSFVSLVGTPITTFPTTSAGYQQYEGNFTPATDGDYYFNVRCQADGTPFYLTLDDFEVDAPACPKPTISVIPTSNSATVTVVGGNSWQYLISTTSTMPVLSDTVNVLTNPFTIPALNANTQYYIWVRDVCGAGVYSSWIAGNFKTPCVANTTFPFTEGFEGTAFPPSCWTANHVSGTVSWERYTSSTPLGTASASVNYGASTGNENWLISPNIVVPARGLELSFWIKCPNAYANTTFNVKVSTTTNDVSAFSSTAALSLVSTSSATGPIPTTWTQKTVDLSAYAGQNIYIGFQVVDANGCRVMLDDIVVDLAPTCIKPTISSVLPTSNSATVTLTGGNATKWQYLISTTSTMPALSDTVNVSTNPFTISALNANTQYYIWVRGNCGTGDYSVWTAGSFRTACVPFGLPFSDNFNSYTASSTIWFNSCWTRYTGADAYVSGTTVYPYISSSYGQSLYFYNSATAFTAAFLPLLDTTDVTLQISFDLQMAAANRFDVVTTANPASARNTWTVLKTINDGTGTGASSYKHYEIIIPNYQAGTYIGLVSYTGATAAYLDNIVVDLAPTCPKPTISSVKPTSNSATVIVAGGTAWQYLVSTTSTMPALSDTVNVSTNPFTIPVLNANTQYYIWVRSVCGAGMYSNWESGSFYTGYCIPATPTTTTYYLGSVTTTGGVTNIAYTNSTANSAGYHNQTGMVVSSYGGNPVTIALIPASTATHYFYCWIDWNNDLTFDVTNETVFATTTYTNNYTGTINIPTGTPVGSYRMRVACSELGVITPCTNNTVGDYVDLTFEVIAAPSCFPTTISDIVPASNSATVTLTGGNATQWQYLISTTNTKPALSDTVNVSTNPFTIPALSANTQYYVWVRGNCGAGDYSAWTNTLTFKTTQLPAVMPYSCGFEDIAENENWILENGTQVNKWFIGGVSDAVNSGSNALYISDAADGSTNNYTISSAISYVYAYRTFALQKDTVYNIMFNWKANGETTSAGWDVLRAFIVPASVSLTAGDAKGMTSSTNTNPSGWIDVPSGSTTSTTLLYLKTSWQTVNKDLKFTGTDGLYNLVFFWKNDGSGGNQPPAAVDNIAFRKKNCITDVNLRDTICSGVPYAGNGFNLPIENLHSGVNTFSMLIPSNVEGVCDTRNNLQLYVIAPIRTVVYETTCSRDPYTKYGFNIQNPETRKYLSMPVPSVHGCDSVFELNLTVQDLQPVTLNKTVCDKDGYILNGDTLKVSGTYSATIPSVLGCDSIINLNLTVLPTVETIKKTLCVGGSYYFDGAYRTTTGIYVHSPGLTNILGCDSTSVLDLTVLDDIVTNFNEAICQGESYTGHGWFNLKVPGTFTERYKTALGCDSTVNLTLVVNPKDTVLDEIYVQVKDLPYTYNTYYTIPTGTSVGPHQVYVSAGKNIYNCDSIVNLTFTITSGFDNLYANSIKMYPNPIKVGSEVTIDCNIPESDRQDIVVEVFNVIGEKIYSVRPNVYPIKVKAFDASGIYVVRIRGAKLHYEGKIVVKE